MLGYEAVMIITLFNTRGVFDVHKDPHAYAGVGMRPVHRLTPSLQCAWRVLLTLRSTRKEVEEEVREVTSNKQQAIGGVNPSRAM